LGTAQCRLEGIRKSFAAGCTVDADCVKAAVDANCIAYGLCEPKPAVLSANVDAFLAAAHAELQSYCGQVSCNEEWACTGMFHPTVCNGGACTSR